MFVKKLYPTDLSINQSSLSAPFKQRSFNATHLNHEFFLLVRDQKYDQAWDLGQKILKQNPNNPAVQRFCDFIKNNHKDLAKMLQDQEDYTDGSEDQEEYEEDQGQEDDDQDSDEEKQSQPSFRTSSNSVTSKASSVSSKSQSEKKVVSLKTVPKTQGNKENAYKWEHNCKNPNCPNRNRPHKH